MQFKEQTIRSEIEYFLPERIVLSENFENEEAFLKEREKCASFRNKNNATALGKGSKIILDFGKEICGGIRIITFDAGINGAKLRISFGESLGEAMSIIGYKNSTNNHSPRDFECLVSTLSDLSFGQTAYRFVLIEDFDDQPINIQSIHGFCKTDAVEKIGKIETNDSEINKILQTAEYTLHLNMQNGYIWDGVKRDRLVWSGDLNQEIITSFYCYGETENVYNSLKFLKSEAEETKWINGIPTYSAWWVINVCDYYEFVGLEKITKEDKEFSAEIIEKINSCISENGEMKFGECGEMEFFLDWPTLESEESKIGTAALMIIAANRYKRIFGDCETADSICKKLSTYLLCDTERKQIRAMQVLAGRNNDDDKSLLQNGGAKGFSTFMAYYILSALHKLGCKNTLRIIRDYFGGMLSKGATTFFEDFDIDWLENSSRIDELPENGKNDIHGDFGNFCYKGYRHSLCHGWASGVYSYFLENIVGLKAFDGFKEIIIKPDLQDLKTISATVPSPYGKIQIDINGNDIKVNAPENINVNIIKA